MSNSYHNPATPLAGFPSILALRDIRRLVRKSLDDRLDRGLTARLLELDPLTVLRCMRVFYAPVHGPRSHVVSIPQLVDRLGVAFVKRAFCNPTVPPGRTRAVRELWLHSLATAVAARGLAQQTGTLSPDQAYVFGLLHDLSQWSQELAVWRNLDEVAISADEWVARWNLPLALSSSGDAASAAAREIVGRAEDLAICAGFRHPNAPAGPTLVEGGQRVPSMQDFVRGNRLRADVVELLKPFGLEPTPEPSESQRVGPDDDTLFPNKTVGRTTDLVLSLASCQRSEHVRSLITATTSAALRYLGFDRAYAIRWIRGLNRCWIRQKADLTPRAVSTTLVALTAEELQMFESAVATGDPQLLVPEASDGEGLMGILGSESAMLVPINLTFHVPTLLLLDRAVSGAPIDARRDRATAKALASLSTLLQENLLLKRQRSRAMKFALTDPLTRLANRGVGIATLRQEIARSNRTNDPLTVLMMDLDKFKSLNDNYGHLVGDQALRTAAQVLCKNTRKMDTVSRYGGEEFVVILPNTSLDDAAVTATRIHASVEAAGVELGLPLTVSIGIAAYRRGEDNVESLLSRADRALYASKDRGRNRFSVDYDEPTRVS
ncbi:MAG: diguanylate cyclase [Planctomycetota bacterium]